MAMDEATAQDLCAYECMWKREPGSVMLGIARSKSGQGGLLIENESLNNNGTTGIDVTLYGALHAKKDCNTGQIHVSVQTDINHTDSSCKLYILNVTGSWKTYLLGTSKLFGKTQMKLSTLFLNSFFFAHLDKATIKPSCCEVSHP